MASALESHLRDIENEARQADRELDELRERNDRRIEEMNREVEEAVARYQQEKALLQEDVARKEARAKKKWDAVASFKKTLNLNSPSVASARPSIFSEPTRNSLASINSIDDSLPSLPAEQVDPPKPAVSSLENSVKPLKAWEEPGYITDQKYLSATPIIVKAPTGKWLELRCIFCGGNYLDKKGWIRGARGMLAHVSKSHKIDHHDGKKLNATNILDYCTHRELTDQDFDAVVAKEQQIEIVYCRDLQTTGQLPTPVKETKPSQITTAGAQEMPHEEDHDRPYDFLQKFPTIVLRKDGIWIEMRCDICQGNSLANSDKRFALGVIGFVRHLSRGHGIKPEHPNQRLEWAVRRCTYRQIPPEEITALTEDLNAKGPPKIPFRQSNRDSTGSDFQAITVKRRPNKRPSEALDLSDEDVDESEEMEIDGGDPDFDPSEEKIRGAVVEPVKKRRFSVATSPKQSFRASKRSVKQSEPSPTAPLSASPIAESPAKGLERFCPCSIAGHACSNPDCKKISICAKNHHDESCLNGHESHEIKPTCVMSLLGEECPDGELCSRAHDQLEDRQRIAAMHDCKSH